MGIYFNFFLLRLLTAHQYRIISKVDCKGAWSCFLVLTLGCGPAIHTMEAGLQKNLYTEHWREQSQISYWSSCFGCVKVVTKTQIDQLDTRILKLKDSTGQEAGWVYQTLTIWLEIMFTNNIFLIIILRWLSYHGHEKKAKSKCITKSIRISFYLLFCGFWNVMCVPKLGVLFKLSNNHVFH